MVTPKWRWVGILNTNLPLMKRNIYHPAIRCSCGLHTWPTLLQSVCKKNILPFTETFNCIAIESIVDGHLRQIKDNLYSYISWSCHSSKGLCPKITFDVSYLNYV